VLGARCIVGVERASHADQMMRQVGQDFSPPNTVGVGQCVARDGLAAKAQVVEMLALHTQIDLDIAQRLESGQLGKRQCQEMIEAGEIFDLMLCPPGQNNSAESLQGQVSHDLRKDELTRMHDRSQHKRSAKHVPKKRFKSWTKDKSDLSK
jgi:hypothetical protein